jgi:hypothetical protein
MTVRELQREKLNWEHRGTAPWQAIPKDTTQLTPQRATIVIRNTKLEQDLLAALDARMASIEAYTGTQSLDWKRARQDYTDGKITFHELNTRIFIRIENKLLNAYVK